MCFVGRTALSLAPCLWTTVHVNTVNPTGSKLQHARLTQFETGMAMLGVLGSFSSEDRPCCQEYIPTICGNTPSPLQRL